MNKTTEVKLTNLKEELFLLIKQVRNIGFPGNSKNSIKLEEKAIYGKLTEILYSHLDANSFEDLRDWDDDGEFMSPSLEQILNNLDYRLKTLAERYATFCKETNQSIKEIPSAEDYVGLKSRIQHIEDYLAAATINSSVAIANSTTKETERQNSSQPNPTPLKISERYKYVFHVPEQTVDINDNISGESFTIPFESLCAIVDEITVCFEK